MGFSHDKTTHHFRLYKDGGSIEALANDPGDAASRQEIRQHLQHIAGMFKSGDFNAPMLIHARTPPGVPTMKSCAIRLNTELKRLQREPASESPAKTLRQWPPSTISCASKFRITKLETR